MARQTSIETYNQIVKNNLLSSCRFAVYYALFHHGPRTAREILSLTQLETNQSGRFTELRDIGVITECGTKICNITGRRAIVWDVTDKLPQTRRLRFRDSSHTVLMNRLIKLHDRIDIFYKPDIAEIIEIAKTLKPKRNVT